jgi:hypothetical protein
MGIRLLLLLLGSHEREPGHLSLVWLAHCAARGVDSHRDGHPPVPVHRGVVRHVCTRSAALLGALSNPPGRLRDPPLLCVRGRHRTGRGALARGLLCTLPADVDALQLLAGGAVRAAAGGQHVQAPVWDHHRPRLLFALHQLGRHHPLRLQGPRHAGGHLLCELGGDGVAALHLPDDGQLPGRDDARVQVGALLLPLLQLLPHHWHLLPPQRRHRRRVQRVQQRRRAGGCARAGPAFANLHRHHASSWVSHLAPPASPHPSPLHPAPFRPSPLRPTSALLSLGPQPPRRAASARPL